MSNSHAQKADPLIDEVRGTRERLVQEHGDLHGWVQYLRRLEQQHPEQVIQRIRRPLGSTES